MTAAPTVAQVLNAARAELGVVENPLGSNRVPYNDWYYGRPVSGPSYPWCAAFVSYVADRSGALAAGIIPRHVYTPSGANWFRARGRWITHTPQVGDLVYYNLGGLGRISHVGIVEAVHADGTWTAIEGNTDRAGGRTGGRVMRQRRGYLGAGGGFGRPAYAATTPPPAPGAGEPPYSVVTVRVQTVLGFTGGDRDGRWGARTDRGVLAVRAATTGRFPYGIEEAQARVGTRVDGDWGAQSRDALKHTVARLQAAWGAGIDGDWGPDTESRWAAARAAYCRL